MSKREELRKKRQKAAQRQQLTVIGVVAAAAIVVSGILIWPSIAPAGDIVVPEPKSYPQVDGKALGPKDAKVVIQEFSDFR
jgi:hypothetical protein